MNKELKGVKLTDMFSIDSHEQQQRKNFVQLNNKDINGLKELLPLMEKNVDRVVEIFYEHLFKFEAADTFFKDEQTLLKVKALQREYLLDLFRGVYDESYFERRLQIGVTHERIGLVPKWYIGSYSNFILLIFPIILKKYLFKPKKLVSSLIALLKVMNLDQQLAIDTYIGSMVNKLTDLGKQIKDLTNVLASSASEITTSTNLLADNMNNVKEISQLTRDKSKLVAENAQKIEQISDQGRKAAKESVGGMDSIKSHMESIKEDIMKLGEQSEAIGEIISSVDDLAEQSNILAINASIEAAKAGDEGKGFSVVAQEIKVLAKQSKDATAQVRKNLSDIQKMTSSAVMTTENGNKAVEVGLKQVTEAGTSIQTLGEGISQATEVAMQIEVSSREQLEVVQQNVIATQQIEGAAKNLNNLGQELKELVEQYER